MVFRYRLKSALAKVVPHLLILLCSFGASLIYWHHWPLPQSASSPAPNWVFTSQLHLGPAVFAYLSILILLRIMAGVTEWISARRPWWDRLRERREPALAKVVPHLLILLCSFGAMLIYWHHWDVPQAESNFVAAFIQLHAPGFYGVLPYWYYFGPGLVIYLVYLLLRRAMLAVIEFVPDWRPWWDRLRERLEPSLAIVFATVVPHLLILLCSFGASLIYWHHWDVPQAESNFVAAFIQLHAPGFYGVLPYWYYSGPTAAVYLAVLLLPRALKWRPTWRRWSLRPQKLLRPLNQVTISTSHGAVLFCAFSGAWLHYYYRPFPPPGSNPVLDLVRFHDPRFYGILSVWHYLAPAIAILLGGLFLLSIYRVWLVTDGPQAATGALPAWPLKPDDDKLGIVIGETHHPVQAQESNRPGWLAIPERGLFTGLAIFGAVGSGKTSACMYPFAQQIFTWQAEDSQRRAAGLVLEVKGDFCHSIHKILGEADREEDYIEIGLNSRWQWNPLAADWLDSYSLAYTISSLLNQLFGKGKEPFWQQAYTNLIRWIIELHRMLPEKWVTMQDVYRCTIDGDHLEDKIHKAEMLVAERCGGKHVIDYEDLWKHKDALLIDQWDQNEETGKATTPFRVELYHLLAKLEIKADIETDYSNTPDPGPATVAAIRRWHDHDWNKLDKKVRTSIVEGVSVFLSMFDLPGIAHIFCPPKPGPPQQIDPDSKPAARSAAYKHLPPLNTLIDEGKVLCLNMPAGTNPALARSIGVLLKNAWLQTLLRRPEEMQKNPGKYFRPALFLCDEYQAFASVGEDDPSGDEKSFALTRQCRCIPIVATQSISSLRSVLHGGEAWRTLLQTLRTKLFLSLSDDSSSKIASELCGTVGRMKASYSFTENTGRAGISMLSGRAGGSQGTLGTSKSYREQREPIFHPRDFSLLSNCQAICLPYDGAQTLPPRRVYLKPHYLPRDRSYWDMRREKKL